MPNARLDAPAREHDLSDSTTSSAPTAPAAAPKASIVIPVFNEEGLLQTAVHDLVVRLASELPDVTYEVIITENGSSDKTLELAYELERKYPGVVRVLHSPEPNYGKALRRGILEARGTYVLCDEIDLCDVGFHARALGLLEADQCDMVIGSKAHRDAQDQRPVFRRAGTAVINGLFRVLLDFKGTDTHGLKGFHRERLLPVVSRCIEDKDLFASELVIRAERDAYRIVEVPIVIAEKRPPSINLMKRVPRVLRGLAKLTWAIRVRGR
ncbi:MAG: glycosyltransferase [Deltaproteobacteria bacterium]|jgi:glycosyltransferase involved in cell wall biosynthesis|nr:glycosyltransferase [Deltaproteobacteria bacterium]